MALYKYVTKERIDILQNCFIRFTQPSALNDPFEVFPNFEALTDNEFIEELLNDPGWGEERIMTTVLQKANEKLSAFPGIKVSKDLLQQEASKLIRKFLPFMKDHFSKMLNFNDPEIRKSVLSIMKESLDKTIGILCLTEKADNILMWSHYTDDHQGFVIEFNEKHNYFDRRAKAKEIRRCLKKVSYSQERPKIMLYDSSKTDDENLDILIDKFLWNKSSHWEYEQEWRMIEVLEECKNKIITGSQEICLFPIPIDCITGIIFGCKTSAKSRIKLKTLLRSDERYFHIIIKHAVMDESDFRLNIV